MDTQTALTPRTIWGWGSMLALAIGSLGPWVTFGPFSANGTSGDGVVTLIVAVVAAILIATGRHRALIAVGTVAPATGIYDTATVSDNGNELFHASIGWGLVLVDLAAVSLIVWGVQARRSSVEASAPAVAP